MSYTNNPVVHSGIISLTLIVTLTFNAKILNWIYRTLMGNSNHDHIIVAV